MFGIIPSMTETLQPSEQKIEKAELTGKCANLTFRLGAAARVCGYKKYQPSMGGEYTSFELPDNIHCMFRTAITPVEHIAKVQMARWTRDGIEDIEWVDISIPFDLADHSPLIEYQKHGEKHGTNNQIALEGAENILKQMI